MRKLLVALGLGAAVTLGAGAAIAQDDGTPRPPAGITMPARPGLDGRDAHPDAGHDARRVAQCDEMHAAMSGHMSGHMGGMTGHDGPAHGSDELTPGRCP